MRRFGIIDGIVCDLDEMSLYNRCSALIEVQPRGISVVRPSWGWKFTQRAEEELIPLELLEMYYRKHRRSTKLGSVKIKSKVYPKPALRAGISVVPSANGVLLNYKDLSVELDDMSVSDFLDLCEMLLGEGGEYNVIFKRH